MVLSASGLAATGMTATAASAATAPTLNLKILLIGNGSADVTTAAWESALKSEGVAYTEVTATGTSPNETVTLPALSSGSTGNYNGVVIADSPTGFAPGALSALDTYESTFGVRQVDGYMYPDPALGVTEAAGGALDGTTGTLTSAGLAAFPRAQGPRPLRHRQLRLRGHGQRRGSVHAVPDQLGRQRHGGRVSAPGHGSPGRGLGAGAELRLQRQPDAVAAAGPRAHQLGHQQRPPGLVPQLLRPGHRRRLHRRQRVELAVPVHARGHRPARLQLPGR